MDIVIAGAEMRAAASPIEDALYELSSICTRVVPVIAELGDTGAFSSQNLDDKCQSLLAGYLHQLASSVESLHDGAVSDAVAFVSKIDEIGSFVY